MIEREILNSYYRQFPKVDDLIQNSIVQQLAHKYGRSLVLEAVRTVLENNRKKLSEAQSQEQCLNLVNREIIVEHIISLLNTMTQPNLRKVINATGVVLHTNLGRAVLSENAAHAVNEVIQGYSNLELDLNSGKRGSRYSHVEELLCRLTGAEAALVVNNNAAAVLLALSALASGKEVIVSRGQLVEIGGAFRIPEVMEQSGCKLAEVGATNKTHLHDYERAINEETALLLKVHTSNYRVVGFTTEVGLRQMVELGRKYKLPVLDDLGSGFLIDLKAQGIGDEPTVQDSVKEGTDVVTFSGDKLLGGPQAGIIVGKKEYIDKMKKHPLNRAVRIDKMTVAALEATLMEYLDEEQALQNIPTLGMIVAKKSILLDKAKDLAQLLGQELDSVADIDIKEDTSQVGGGSMPLTTLETYVVTVEPKKLGVTRLAEGLRRCTPAVMGRVSDEKLLLDVRTVKQEEFIQIAKCLTQVLR